LNTTIAVHWLFFDEILVCR